MKTIQLLTLTALLLSPLAALHAQQPSAPSTATVRDRLWIFTVYAEGNNRENQVGPSLAHKHYIDDYAPGGSRMTPAEGAFWLGVPNLLFSGEQPVPVDLIRQQCDLGLKWLKEGRVSDIIFLANTMLDVGMPSAEFAREWVKKIGGEKLNRETNLTP